MSSKVLVFLILLAFPQIAFTDQPGEVLVSTGHHPADQNSVSESNCDHSHDVFRCVTYLYNHDGDTLTVRVKNVHPLIGEKVPVRISGIDSPEMYGSDGCERVAARQAQQLVAMSLKNAQRIDLHALQRDKYFRVLADVRVDGVSLASILLRAGLAYPYSGGSKKKIDWCEVASAQAN